MLAVVARTVCHGAQEGRAKYDIESGDLYVGNTTHKTMRVTSAATFVRIASILLVSASILNLMLVDSQPVSLIVATSAVLLAGVSAICTWRRLGANPSFEEGTSSHVLDRIGPGCLASAGAAFGFICISIQARHGRFMARPNFANEGSIGRHIRRHPESLLIARYDQFGVEAEMAKSKHAELIPKPLKQLRAAHEAAQDIEGAEIESLSTEKKIGKLAKQALGPDPDIGPSQESQQARGTEKNALLHVVGADPDAITTNARDEDENRESPEEGAQAVGGEHLTVEGGDEK